MEIFAVREHVDEVVRNIEKVIYGKREELRLVIAALLAGGHVLLEDFPGTGKTMLSQALAKSFGCSFSRIQFTPDLLPSELSGINFYNPKTGDFTFKQGSLFASIILADEINRATPRTQSGLLESMQEGQITVDGKSYLLPKPYFVIATQNPIETQGTFPLPEAQLDRFLLWLSLGYPDRNNALQLMQNFIGDIEQSPFADVRVVCQAETLLDMQRAVRGVFIHQDVLGYIWDLAAATRNHESVALGISTRGALALARLCQSHVALMGASFVRPQDVQSLIPHVFAHRIVLKGGIKSRREAALSVLDEVVSSVAVPTEDFKR